jgi:hypothetical protein
MASSKLDSVVGQYGWKSELSENFLVEASNTELKRKNPSNCVGAYITSQADRLPHKDFLLCEERLINQEYRKQMKHRMESLETN